MGGELLTTSLRVVDADHLPAYLESSNPRNITLYERHGFEVTREIPIEGGPSMTAMWRPAR
jgi:ribosomal protein S18 acetylase RimI-like enzyme